MPSRKEIFDSIVADYPTLPHEFIHTLLDLHEKEPEYLEKIIKEQRKKHKRVPEPKTQLSLEEMERIQKKIDELPKGSITIEKAPEVEVTEVESNMEEEFPKVHEAPPKEISHDIEKVVEDE